MEIAGEFLSAICKYTGIAELIACLDKLSARSNRARNERINLLLESAAEIVRIEE